MPGTPRNGVPAWVKVVMVTAYFTKNKNNNNQKKPKQREDIPKW